MLTCSGDSICPKQMSMLLVFPAICSLLTYDAANWIVADQNLCCKCTVVVKLGKACILQEAEGACSTRRQNSLYTQLGHHQPAALKRASDLSHGPTSV